MKKTILVILLFISSLAYSANDYKLTDLRVKSTNGEWSKVLKPNAGYDPVITATLDLGCKKITINTPTKQVFKFNSFQIDELAECTLISAEATDFRGVNVVISVCIYRENGERYFSVKYSDGEYMYKILK